MVSWKVRTWPMRATRKAGTAGERLAVERTTCPCSGLSKPRQQVEQRGLAGAVRADQGGDRAARDLEVLDVDGREAAEAAA